MNELNTIQQLAVWALPVLFAITVHEVAHGWIAKQCGDPTAQMMGRLTLNPVKHIDPIGTLLVPGILLVLGGFMFGWAKPVPVTWENLRHPRRDVAFVALAGPGANLVMAIIWALLMKLGLTLYGSGVSFAYPLVLMGQAGIMINIILMVLNLLPIPPLDGGRVLSAVLPGPWAWRLSRIEPYGIIIVLLLLAFGLLPGLIGGPVTFLQNLMYSIVSLGG
ncbi:MAG: site-2 protease family protein [Gammaproteobacteria bacterium]|nr:site-2 protease family protein [Gammaproteobacteria bacterium]